MHSLMQNVKFVKGFDPVADAYNGTLTTDVIDMRDWSECVFVIHEGVGLLGTAVITVESCDDVVPTTTTAIAFEYKTILTTDAESVITNAAAAGFTTTAGSSELYVISVKAEDLSGTNQFVRLKATESVNDPVLAGVLVILHGGRYPADSTRTAIV